MNQIYKSTWAFKHRHTYILLQLYIISTYLPIIFIYSIIFAYLAANQSHSFHLDLNSAARGLPAARRQRRRRLMPCRRGTSEMAMEPPNKSSSPRLWDNFMMGNEIWFLLEIWDQSWWGWTWFCSNSWNHSERLRRRVSKILAETLFMAWQFQRNLLLKYLKQTSV